MSKYFNSKYSQMKAYTPGEQPKNMDYIKLNTNESPYPPSQSVIKAITKQEVEDLRLYPDPTGENLKEALASLYKVKAENVYIANGSDDILNFAFMAYGGDGRKAVFPEISYGFYQVFADLNSVEYVKLPLKDDFSIDIRDYCNLKDLIIIANPNAPTGICLGLSEIEKILKTNKNSVIVIDEAYVDFGAESAVPLTTIYDNLLVVQTFSKSRSMAGARLGFAIGNSELINDLEMLKYSTNPYNVNRLSMVAGIAAVESNAYYVEKCKEIINTRDYTSKELNELGFDVLPSKANFLFAKSNDIGGKELYLKLKERGILIRHFDNSKICEYNRITIGTKKQMETMIKMIKEILR